MNHLKIMSKPESFFIQSIKQSLYFLLTSILITGYASAQLPTIEWVATMGSSSFDYVNAIDTDSQGNVYATGIFSGTVDFDPGPDSMYLTSNGSFDCFVLKLDASGNFLWAKPTGGASADTGLSITIDSNDDVYITGNFGLTVDFDPGVGTMDLTSNGGRDVFVQKLDSNGDFLWAKAFGAIGTDTGNSIAVDASGNVYVLGNFYFTVDFDPGAGVMNSTSNGSYDVFVQKLDPSGNFIWVKVFGGLDHDPSKSIAIDSSGIYVAGYYISTVDFDPGAGVVNHTSNGGEDIFIQKLNLDGDFLWVRVIGASGSDRANSITADMNGNVYVTGNFEGSPDFDPGVGTTYLSGSGNEAVYVLKMDSNGSFDWAKAMGGSGLDLGTSITTDSDGNTYTTGSFEQAVDFDPGVGTMNLTSNGAWDIYVQKLDPNGNHLWTISSGSIESEAGNGITTDATGNIFVGGYFRGVVDFDPGPGIMSSTSNGGPDCFIQKIASEVCQPTSSIDVQSACNSYTWIDGNTYTSSNNVATDTMINVAGCDSIITLDLTINGPSSSTIDESVCESYTSPSGVLLSNSGTYLDTIPNSTGCDSVITINLTVNSMDLSILQTVGVNLVSNESTIGTAYQWLNCDLNFDIITGEIGQSFTASINGNYAVELTQGNCVDTSTCFSVNNVGLFEDDSFEFITLFPNPVINELTIFTMDQDYVTIAISNPEGKVVIQKTLVKDQSNIDMSNLANGVYFVLIKTTNKTIVERIIKN